MDKTVKIAAVRVLTSEKAKVTYIPITDIIHPEVITNEYLSDHNAFNYIKMVLQDGEETHIAVQVLDVGSSIEELQKKKRSVFKKIRYSDAEELIKQRKNIMDAQIIFDDDVEEGIGEDINADDKKNESMPTDTSLSSVDIDNKKFNVLMNDGLQFQDESRASEVQTYVTTQLQKKSISVSTEFSEESKPANNETNDKDIHKQEQDNNSDEEKDEESTLNAQLLKKIKDLKSQLELERNQNRPQARKQLFGESSKGNKHIASPSHKIVKKQKSNEEDTRDNFVEHEDKLKSKEKNKKKLKKYKKDKKHKKDKKMKSKINKIDIYNPDLYKHITNRASKTVYTEVKDGENVEKVHLYFGVSIKKIQYDELNTSKF